MTFRLCEFMKHELLSTADWIWLPGGLKEDNQYVVFKVPFVLPAYDEETILRIAVSGNYAAYLNNKLIGFGQYTDHPHKKTYTEINLCENLLVGQNELIVEVHYSGNDFSSHLDGEPGLIAAISQGGRVIIYSDENWLIRSDTRFSQGPRERLFVSFNYTFEFDARKELPPWQKACVLPRRECTMTERPIEPPVIVDEITARPVKTGYLLRDERLYDTNAMRCNADIHDPESNANGIYVLYDLGRETAGHISIDFNLPEGTIVDIIFGEHLTDGFLRGRYHNATNFTDRYIAKGGEENFTHFLRRIACRYIELHIIGSADDTAPPDVRFIKVELPNMETPPFDASDDFWIKSHEVSAETLRLCLHEKFENCPWREQSICMYDARNQMLFGYYYWGNYSKAKAMLTLFADGLRDDGFMPVTAPSRKRLSIPSFTFLWFTALYEYTLYSGDLSLFKGYKDMIRGMLGKILTNQREGLYIPPEDGLWNYCEAPELEERTDMPNAFYNLYLLEALRLLAKLFIMTNDKEDAEKLTSTADDITRKAERYYDATKEAYADSVLPNGTKDTFHGHINSLFLANGIVSQNRAGNIIRQIIGGKLPMQATSSMIYLIKGIFNYGTDEDRITLHKFIKSHFAKMLGTGTTTWWEVSLGEKYGGGAGSLCHGWSAIPAWYEGAVLLGVTPLEPGFKRFRVKPYVGDLTFAKGRVPSPYGDINVEWKRTDNGIDVTVSAHGATRIASSDEWVHN